MVINISQQRRIGISVFKNSPEMCQPDAHIIRVLNAATGVDNVSTYADSGNGYEPSGGIDMPHMSLATAKYVYTTYPGGVNSIMVSGRPHGDRPSQARESSVIIDLARIPVGNVVSIIVTNDGFGTNSVRLGKIVVKETEESCVHI